MASPTPINPYEAPQVNLENDFADNADDYWREGKLIILKKEGHLPARCVKCNAASVTPFRKKTLAWHHPAWYLLIFIHPLIYVVAGLIVRKRAKIEFGLCHTHLTRRNVGIWVSMGSFLAAIGTLVWLMDHPGAGSGIWLLVAMGFLIAIIFAVAFARSIYARKINETEVHIGGCGKPFLEGAMRRVIY